MKAIHESVLYIIYCSFYLYHDIDSRIYQKEVILNRYIPETDQDLGYKVNSLEQSRKFQV